MAEDTMALVERVLGRKTRRMGAWFKALPSCEGASLLDEVTFRYLRGRYGADLSSMITDGKGDDFEHIAGLPNVWAELKQVTKSGYVEHLDDLLLRRVRLGLLLPEGGSAELPRIKNLVQEDLGWDELRWNQEVDRYNQIYQNYYSPNPRGIQKG